MKKEDFTKKKDAELVKMLTEKREALRAFRFGTAGSAAREVKSLYSNKKDVARILTELAVRSRKG